MTKMRLFKDKLNLKVVEKIVLFSFTFQILFMAILLTGCSQSEAVIRYQCADGSIADTYAACSIATCPTTTCSETDCPKVNCPEVTCPELSCPEISCPEVTSSSPQAVDSNEYEEIVSFKGKGNQDTESFKINTNKVKITAKTSGGLVGSYSSIELESETRQYLHGASLSISAEAGEQGTGETIIRNLESGNYYISVISGVEWEVSIYEAR